MCVEKHTQRLRYHPKFKITSASLVRVPSLLAPIYITRIPSIPLYSVHTWKKPICCWRAVIHQRNMHLACYTYICKCAHAHKNTANSQQHVALSSRSARSSAQSLFFRRRRGFFSSVVALSLSLQPMSARMTSQPPTGTGSHHARLTSISTIQEEEKLRVGGLISIQCAVYFWKPFTTMLTPSYCGN